MIRRQNKKLDVNKCLRLIENAVGRKVTLKEDIENNISADMVHQALTQILSSVNDAGDRVVDLRNGVHSECKEVLEKLIYKFVDVEDAIGETRRRIYMKIPSIAEDGDLLGEEDEKGIKMSMQDVVDNSDKLKQVMDKTDVDVIVDDADSM